MRTFVAEKASVPQGASCPIQGCRNGGMVDTKDLKSFGTKVSCGFKSHFLYFFIQTVANFFSCATVLTLKV